MAEPTSPRVYGPSADASYFQDVALASLMVPGSNEARERLNTYDSELDVERQAGSAEGRRAASIDLEVRSSGRHTVEARAGATSATIAGFTTPSYLLENWAAFRSPARSFTDQTTQLPLPKYGLQVNVPSFTSATAFAVQAEGTTVAALVPGGAGIASTVVPIVGEVTVSQQLFDRGGMPGAAFDKILLAQMKNQLDAAVDAYVLAQALANAGEVTDAVALTIPDFLADVSSGRELLSDTAGVRLLATHLFSTSDFFNYIARQVDQAGRPILPPDSGAIVAATIDGDPRWNNWTGVHLGQSRWHTDDNIPASGANTQVIVARPSEVFTFVGDPIPFAYPGVAALAQQLSVVIGLRCYVGVVVRFPKCVAVLGGAAFPLTLI